MPEHVLRDRPCRPGRHLSQIRGRDRRRPSPCPKGECCCCPRSQRLPEGGGDVCLLPCHLQEAEYQRLRLQWQQRLTELEPLIGAAEAEVQEARSAKDTLEAAEEARRRLNEEAAAPADPGHDAPGHLEQHQQSTDLGHDAGYSREHQTDHHLEHDSHDHLDHGSHLEHGSHDHLEHGSHDHLGGSAEEDPEEIGRRIAARWTHDPEAAGYHEEAEEAPAAAEHQPADEDAGVEGDGKKRGGLLGKALGAISGMFGGSKKAPAAPPADHAPPEDIPPPTPVYEEPEELRKARQRPGA